MIKITVSVDLGENLTAIFYPDDRSIHIKDESIRGQVAYVLLKPAQVNALVQLSVKGNELTDKLEG
jgi:hypothetical protein